MRIRQHVCCLLLIAVLGSVAACGRKSESVQVQYYPVCYEPLAYLHQRSGGTGSAIAGGALQAGVLSGMATAIIGAIAGGVNGTSMAVGIGVGSAIGGTMGAMGKTSAQQREDNKHLAAYLEQIDGDIDGLDIVSAAAKVSQQCYNREFRQLLMAMKDRTVTEQAALSRFNEIKAGENETAQLLKQQANMPQLQAEFDKALREEGQSAK